jgi:hypothetical protein
MNAFDLKTQLCQALVKQSGLDRHRRYLGMSGIGYCPRQLYDRYLHGLSDYDEQSHWRSWLGYLFEAGLIRLFDNNLLTQHAEIVAAYDSRFRGHIDHQTADGDLVEIKSVDWYNFNRIRAQGPKRAHRAQVQMYLRHGGWPRAFLIYVARDMPWQQAWPGFPLWVFEERPDDDWADALDAKAQDILEALDGTGPLPVCSCGRCGKSKLFST